MSLFKKNLPFFLVVLLSLFAILPLFYSGFFPIHDDTQVSRVFEMFKSLNSGMFPVRWVSDLGYGAGYPIFNFYAPLAYYFGAIFMFMGFDALISTKIMIGVGVMLAGISIYLLAKEIWNKETAIISALFYMYAPYHAVNIYVRGAVSELWAYAFIPLAFYGALALYKRGEWKNLIVFSLSFAGIILSHNLTAMMVAPFLFIYVLILLVILFREKKKKRAYLLLSGFVLGILVSSFYFIPALLEIDKTNVSSQLIGGSDFRKNFACINQLWDSPWGFGGSVSGCIDGMSFKIGKLHVLLSFFSFFLAILGVSYLKKDEKVRKKAIFGLILFLGFILSIFLTTSSSGFIWESLKPMTYIQYPWRFLSLAAFFSSLLVGFVIWTAYHKKRNIALVIAASFILLLFYSDLKLFNPQKIVLRDSSYYTSEASLKWRVSKISDEYLPKNFNKPKTEEDALKNNVIFSFEETPIEKTANIISLASLFILIIGIIPWVKRKKS